MFLKSLDINGFKSFADKTHIDFADGITSLLGPNGCGKSNIVDSIKWVLGEQSTKTLRAGKMEDVIFNGTDTRKPLQFAEVALTIDNSEHKLQTELTEIEIKRRVFRSGESEYYLNRQRCLLKNIRELFFDTGIGKSADSILERGKIDQILSSKPEDRRYIFEEAAGISRFKAECNEAQKKIDRTNENILQVENLLAGEKRRYTTLKGQADKAISYNNLIKRQLDLDITLHAIQLQTFTRLKTFRAEQKASNEKQLSALMASLDSFKSNIEEEQILLREKNTRSYEIQTNINKAEEAIRSRNERVRMLEEQYREYLRNQRESENTIESLKSIINRDKAELDTNQASMSEKEEILEEAEEQINRANGMIADDLEKISTLEELVRKEDENILSLERETASLSDELKSVIENLVLELDQKMGEEYSCQKRKEGENNFNERLDSLCRRIREKLSFYSSLPQGSDIREKLESDFTSILESLESLRTSFDSYKAAVPPFIDSLLAPEGLLTKKRTIEENEERCRAGIEKSRQRIAQARIEISSLSQEVEGLRETVRSMEIKASSIKAGLESFKTIVQNLKRTIEENTVNLEDSEDKLRFFSQRIETIGDSLKATDDEKKDLSARIESLKEDLIAVKDEISQLNCALVSREAEKDRTIETIQTLKTEIEKTELWQSQIDDQIKMLFTSFFNTYNRSLNEYQDRLESDDLPEEVLIRNELDEVRKQIASLGPNINHMAIDDFKEVEEQYNFYTKQLDDLNKAKADLEKVLTEIQQKSEEMFLSTYKQISDNFQAMFKRLFNGGRAEITLADEENILTSGIDIFAQPPGKKLISLTLLSGGERSMTAVALLFATYLVKPSPFCILDEIDAALDDKNIGYFLSVLQDFSQTSQFIIITHNTHTVMGSTSLLGVTQMEAGVSTTVTYKLASIEGQPVILDEDNERVDFDKDGKRKEKS